MNLKLVSHICSLNTRRCHNNHLFKPAACSLFHSAFMNYCNNIQIGKYWQPDAVVLSYGHSHERFYVAICVNPRESCKWHSQFDQILRYCNVTKTYEYCVACFYRMLKVHIFALKRIFFHILTHIDTTRDETYLSHVMKTGVLQIAQLSRRFGGKSVRLRV